MCKRMSLVFTPNLANESGMSFESNLQNLSFMPNHAINPIPSIPKSRDAVQNPTFIVHRVGLAPKCRKLGHFLADCCSIVSSLRMYSQDFLVLKLLHGAMEKLKMTVQTLYGRAELEPLAELDVSESCAQRILSTCHRV